MYRGAELRWIGMPVGGICCGQLYLGGDGRLWLWDVFQSKSSSDYAGMASGAHYADPPEPTSPLQQGFPIRVASAGREEVRPLDATGFGQVAVRGEVPIGRVTYRDDATPIEVDLEAFSPFVPLDSDESSLPATVMSFRVRNAGRDPASVTLAGWLESAVCPQLALPAGGNRVNRILARPDRLTLAQTAEVGAPAEGDRPPIVCADFEGDAYEGWTVEGTAFGAGPFRRAEMAPYHDVSGHVGERLANSHHTRGGEDVHAGDAHTGRLTSRSFRIDRRFVNFRIGGGRHPGETCLNLVIDGQVVRTATGHDANRMREESFDVADLAGRTAHLEIVDAVAGPWGNIGIDQIEFADRPAGPELEDRPGYGSMALTVVAGDGASGAARLSAEATPVRVFADLADPGPDRAAAPFGTQLVGAIGREVELGPGAAAIAGHVVRHLDRLAGTTRLWNGTWYDSTLPCWLLDRAFVPLDCLATRTCHWFDSGRFWVWEGVGCCPGTCQHVWNYAQGLARLYPALERRTREHVDYGIAFRDSGELGYRAENGPHIAHDGQCGTILRTYREQLTAPDDAYLKRIWPRVRRSIEFLIAQDGGEDGVLEGGQYNTLDQTWYGPMAWISSIFVAALRAGEAMAERMGDPAFAARCGAIAAAGTRKIAADLFDGEHFIHRPDPAHPEVTNTNAGCHIDQVLGQSLAWPVGLPHVVPPAETISALNALWKYNFAPDAGAHREAMQGVIRGGRWYAMPGEVGLVMCTWPKGGAERAAGQGYDWAVGYFNECMNGFEYQVASHLVWEGEPDSELVTKGLAVMRAVHDRYHPSRRNPYNEIECSDHYSRSMASYGVFLAACGFEYDGPRRHLGFAPRLRPDDFRAAFTAAEGWGSLRQARDAAGLRAAIEVRGAGCGWPPWPWPCPPERQRRPCGSGTRPRRRTRTAPACWSPSPGRSCSRRATISRSRCATARDPRLRGAEPPAPAFRARRQAVPGSRRWPHARRIARVDGRPFPSSEVHPWCGCSRRCAFPCRSSTSRPGSPGSAPRRRACGPSAWTATPRTWPPTAATPSP
ncbi:MAG: GH116 family glycosyl hydrolase [Planctomycetota bacterium]